jgi:hypothetical protein
MTYKNPFWWTRAFGWITFFPLSPSFDGPIFESLLIPGRHQFTCDEDGKFMMPRSLAKRWFQIEQELFNAIHIIQSHYQIPIIYPVYPSAFGYLKAHKSKEGLTLSMTKVKDWFTIWMALFSYVIAQATTI